MEVKDRELTSVTLPDPLTLLVESFSGSDADRLPAAFEAFGQAWRFADIYAKAFPCGLLCFPATRAALRAHAVFEFGELATSVRVLASPNAARITNCPSPADSFTAALSIEHAVACALLFGRLDLSHYTDEVVHSTAVAAYRHNVCVKSDESLDDGHAQLAIETSHGRSFVIEGLPAPPPQSVEHRRNTQLKADSALEQIGADAKRVKAAVSKLRDGGSMVDVLAVCRHEGVRG